MIRPSLDVNVDTNVLLALDAVLDDSSVDDVLIYASPVCMSCSIFE